jgi:hypothetical protein
MKAYENFGEAHFGSGVHSDVINEGLMHLIKIKILHA